MTNNIQESAIQQAQRLHEKAEREMDQIRADTRLSDEGREAALREYVDGVNANLDTLLRQYSDAGASIVSAASARVFKRSGDAVADRDAAARARQIQDPEEMHELLDVAHRQGDRVLAGELVAEAIRNGWGQLAEKFCALYPDTEDDLQVLWDARRKGSFGSRDGLHLGGHFHFVHVTA